MKTKNTSYKTSSINIYQYWGKVVKIVDGDTIDLDVSLGFETNTKKRFRLVGIDTPEMFGVPHSSSEYKKGLEAKKKLEGLIPQSNWVEVKVFQSSNREKYGRYLAELFVDGKSINKKMEQAGYKNINK